MTEKPRARPRLTLETIFDSKTFEEKSLRSPRWMNDGRRLCFIESAGETPAENGAADERDTLWLLNSASGERQHVLDPAILKLESRDAPLPLAGYQWSPDESALLLTERAPARFSHCGNLYLYTLADGALRALTATDQPQRFPRFSPDGRYVGLVRADDLWLLSPTSGEERRLTFDASPTVYNGRFGWVYEEELHLQEGWWWSPDGARIAFVRQDESRVPAAMLPRYEEPHAEPLITRYPQPGDPNPGARVGILTVATGEVLWLDLGADGGDPCDCYLARVQWAPSGDGLLIQRIPRLQNRIEVIYADASTGSTRTVVTEEDRAWVTSAGAVRFIGDTDRFVWPSDRSGWTHLYLADLKGGDLRLLTSGEWDVSEVVHAGPDGILFAATRPSATQRRLYRVGLDGGEPVCLTGDEPGWHSALASDDGARYLHTWSSANVPTRVDVRETAAGARGAGLPVIEDSAPGIRHLPLLGWEFVRVPTERGDTLNARILRPAARSGAPTSARPALIIVYGGPGHQIAVDAWGGPRSLWYQLLAQAGYFVLMVDGRGTGGRGREWQKCTYQRLGERETEDQISAARWLASQPDVDPSRIGIWGWSYGGYMAALCLLRGADVFRAGVAVAPVTDWRLYDSIYTERYMRAPADNPEGYAATSAVAEAAKLKGRLLLVHGLLDDNVHFQHTARLAEALQEAKLPFETMFYPGKRHGIDDRHYHLFKTTREFLRRSLGR